MNLHIRPYSEDDLDAIVELSLLAWEPVFTAWQEILGPKLYPIAIYPDWRKSQKEVVNTFALQRLKDGGMKLAVVGTGGDEGHAPARRSYEKAGYTALPLVRYYKDL
jgi:hypothetical protein